MDSRQEAEDAIEEANSLSDDEFLRRFIRPRDKNSSPDIWPTWTHPHTGAAYHLRLARTEALTEKEVDECLALVEETSGDDYRASAGGWRRGAKRREMGTPGLRNKRARDFYRRLGYGLDPSSPPERRELRGGREVESQYLILSLVVGRQ
ncbi:hypothetical protein CP532_5447 [Ophiocordyceps camponoti-leonardi (nom. inval.)]|nr:hypothetical protein CP532_5447 [Ophiocordyceps camponoti-leonardi (nom. inval.)]